MLKLISVILFGSSVLSPLFSSFAKADYIGFASGMEFQATPIEGTVILTCEGFNGSSQVTYTCRDVVLDPVNEDIFIGPKDFRAKQIELHAFHEDGSDRSKVSAYDGASGKSVTTFNLWLSSLFQRPLLATGVNRISYRIYDNTVDPTQEYGNGVITINVKRGPQRRCPTTQYQSGDIIDCNSQYSICQRYFDQYNHCH